MATIQIKTDVPGPRSKSWIERNRAIVPLALAPHLPVIVDRAEGALLHDLDGNTFIDLAAGIGSLNAGHAPPKVVEAVANQAARFTHTDFSLVPYAPYIELAEKLAERAPVRGERKVAFFNSGAEAVENAVKIARYATRRPAVLAFEGAFHGRTLMALTLTSKAEPYKAGFGPYAPEVYRTPYPNPFRCRDPETCGEEALRAIENVFVTHVSPGQVAAVIVEPVQGEGGFVVPPADFLPGLRRLCDRHGILLIVDEIQSGFGRTGRFFALEHFGVEADLITVGKSIAAGIPLSGVIGRKELMDSIPGGGIGGTTIGNPIACAAGLAVLEAMDEGRLVERAKDIGRRLRSRLEPLVDRFPWVGEVRGLGAMVGLELVRDRASKEPAGDLARRVISALLQRGVLLVPAGVYGNVLRFLPPLVIEERQLDEALGVVEEVLESCAGPS